MGNGSLSRGQSGLSVVLNSHPHLASRLKEEYNYIFTPALDLRVLFCVKFTFIFTFVIRYYTYKVSCWTIPRNDFRICMISVRVPPFERRVMKSNLRFDKLKTSAKALCLNQKAHYWEYPTFPQSKVSPPWLRYFVPGDWASAPGGSRVLCRR
jgi:hypothetical protein